MAIELVPFGQSTVDERVKKWLESKGINPNDVLSYRIEKGPNCSTIELKLWLDDEKERKVSDLFETGPEGVPAKVEE